MMGDGLLQLQERFKGPVPVFFFFFFFLPIRLMTWGQEEEAEEWEDGGEGRERLWEGRNVQAANLHRRSRLK